MPRTVVVLGASPDRRKFGNKAVRAFAQAGFDVYPVHPTAPAVEGRPAFKSVADVPLDAIDTVTVYLPPAVGVAALDALVGKQIGRLILNPGADGPAVLARAQQLGLPVVTGCSIIGVGLRPDMFPDE